MQVGIFYNVPVTIIYMYIVVYRLLAYGIKRVNSGGREGKKKTALLLLHCKNTFHKQNKQKTKSAVFFFNDRYTYAVSCDMIDHEKRIAQGM